MLLVLLREYCLIKLLLSLVFMLTTSWLQVLLLWLHSFLASLRKMWKTSDPQFLSLDADLPFLGVSIRMTKDGILLHQHHYTQDLLHNHSSHVSARKRNTSGEPTHFQKDPPLPPDPTNSEHQRWIKIGQRILGGLLWLSTRTRPDLAFAVSSAAQVLTQGYWAAQGQTQTPFAIPEHYSNFGITLSIP